MDPIADAATTSIVCRVTPWYYRRMSLITGVLVFMGLYFLYDGRYGYPEANRIADKKQWFEEVLLKEYDAAKAAGNLDAWVEKTRAKGLPTGRDGEPPRWVSYAAENGWHEAPHRYTDREIREQFWWGGATLLAGLGVLGVLLRNRSKVLRAESDHWITPEGQVIRYDQVFRVDKRPWAVKALAYIWHRPSPEAPARRAVIDDLKFDGAGRVLDRILAQFQGEVIEKSPSEPTSSDKPVA